MMVACEDMVTRAIGETQDSVCLASEAYRKDGGRLFVEDMVTDSHMQDPGRLFVSAPCQQAGPGPCTCSFLSYHARPTIRWEQDRRGRQEIAVCHVLDPLIQAMWSSRNHLVREGIKEAGRQNVPFCVPARGVFVARALEMDGGG